MIQEVKKSKLSVEDSFVKQSKDTITENSSNSKAMPDEKLYKMSQDDAILENIIDEIRADSTKMSDENYRKIFNYVVEENAKEFAEVKELVQKEKDALYNKVKQGQSFSASIKNKSQLRSYYRDVFGKNKTEISFEDYMVLLEMKRVLEIDEQISMAEVEEV